MKWLNNLKIKYKIYFILLFPILGLLYFSSIDVIDKYHIVAEMDTLEELALVAVKTAEVIHQVQLERLTSVKFLKHHGQKWKQELGNEQSKTDQVSLELKTQLTQLFQEFETASWYNTFQRQADQIFLKIEGLKAQRTAIQALNISELKTIEQYGAVNNTLLDFIKQIAKLSSNKKIFTLELAYINFLAAKELAALERSLLVNALTQKYFELGEFQHFVELVAQQQVYRQIIFMFLATDEQKAFFEQTMKNEAVEATQKIRDMVYASASDGLIENIDPNFWAEMQTEKIELLKRVETQLAQDLRTQADHIHGTAHTDFLIAIAIILIILALVIALAIVILRSMITQINQAVNVANEITKGNLNNQVDIQGKDEIGQLLQAFAQMQQQLSTQLEQEINLVIHAASQGLFDQRISLEDKTGFFHTVSESINQIVEFNQIMVEDVMRVFAALSNGDLTQTIENEYMGTFEQLKSDANVTVEKLTEIMTAIKQAAQVVNTAAEEISQGNLSLSQRTEQQAASLEETAASMEQMTSTVQQNADNAKQATQLAISAKNLAEKGGEVMGSAMTAITEISNSSTKITDIISVIDEIAFQTNLLALNAAVEAARAGDQGRGFAVVASEVRSLAQRSGAAAKEIKELIQDSVSKVEEGTKLANKSGETLEDIVLAVKKVNDIIIEIAAASQEQSSGIQQVNKTISQMDEMTQQNASLVEEAASASESMNEQAQNLQRQVAFFNIGLQTGEPFKKKSKKSVVNRSILPQTTSPKSLTPIDENDDGWEEF